MTPSSGVEHRLLIVENSELIADAVERAGLRLNLIADKVNDGWDAIAKLEEQDYDAIIVDVNLPRFSGFGVFTYLREERGHDLENLILMTDSNEDEISRRLGEDSVTVIRKDHVEELQSAIEACASRSALTRQR